MTSELQLNYFSTREREQRIIFVEINHSQKIDCDFFRQRILTVMIYSHVQGSYPVNRTRMSVVRNGTIYDKFIFIVMRLDRLFELFNGCYFLQLQPSTG